MEHVITSASTAATERTRVEPARRSGDQVNTAGEDALRGFKGIAHGMLLSMASWLFLLGMYFLV